MKDLNPQFAPNRVNDEPAMNNFNYLSGRRTFEEIFRHTHNLFLNSAHKVQAMDWQGRQVRPEFATMELMNYSFTHNLKGISRLETYRKGIEPNLPWADDHFEERVCGHPINPGIQWENWPWGGSADSFRDESGMFNHNYMERFWPRHAGHYGPTLTPQDIYDEEQRRAEDCEGPDPRSVVNRGIRNPYGDLHDWALQLARNPFSRQEWFPIFHPEDVGEVIGGRKPCSLGYQVWCREDKLHMYYPLRSCDFAHHMRDDVYLAIRMMLWLIKVNASCDSKPNFDYWKRVKLGTLTFHATSLHVFINDFHKMKREGPL